MYGVSAGQWVYSSGPLRALGLDFSVRSTEVAFGAAVAELLAPLRAGATGQAVCTYTVVSSMLPPDGRVTYTVTAGDETVSTAPTAHAAVAHLLWDLNRRVIGSSQKWLLLHAAAVAAGDRVVMMPGPSGAGKSTLAAALVAGGMEYLSDEVTALDPATREVVPYPSPLKLERASWGPLAALAPAERPPSVGFEDPAPWFHQPARTASAGEVPARRPIRFVVVPRFVAGSPSALEPMRRSAALVALAQSSFQRLHRRPGGLEALAEVVRGCTCLQLRFGDLGYASSSLAAQVRATGAPARR